MVSEPRLHPMHQARRNALLGPRTQLRLSQPVFGRYQTVGEVLSPARYKSELVPEDPRASFPFGPPLSLQMGMANSLMSESILIFSTVTNQKIARVLCEFQAGSIAAANAAPRSTDPEALQSVAIVESHLFVAISQGRPTDPQVTETKGLF